MNSQLSEFEQLVHDDLAEQFFAKLTLQERTKILYHWRFWARRKQLAPVGSWQFWLLLAGRGFGKTRSICEWAIEQAKVNPNLPGVVVGATAGDVRDILIEGESGIMNISDPDFMPVYEPSKRRLTWPNGAWANLRSADKPDGLRGVQGAWAVCDELAAWRYAREAWDMLLFGLRLGNNPRAAIATTPRPTPIIKQLVKDETCHLTTGTTYENSSNLADQFFKHIVSRYKGTRLGRQELNAEILGDTEGALWRMGSHDERGTIEGGRIDQHPSLIKIVVGVDPPAQTTECGIVVTGSDINGKIYVLDDVSVAGTPDTWARAVVDVFYKWQADEIIAEVNQGGAMVANTIRNVRDSNDKKIGHGLPIRSVHATRGKRTRAEPLSLIYEQGNGHHVGAFPKLEDEMSTWVVGDDSPNRLDALVWAAYGLGIVKFSSKAGSKRYA